MVFFYKIDPKTAKISKRTSGLPAETTTSTLQTPGQSLQPSPSRLSVNQANSRPSSRLSASSLRSTEKVRVFCVL